MRKRYACVFVMVVLASGDQLLAQRFGVADPKLTVPLPERGRFVVDAAGLLDVQQEQRIQLIAERLHREQQTPLFVVTIDAMAAYGGVGKGIEDFSRNLLHEWQFKSRWKGGVDWGKSILFLVAKENRRARIQFATPRDAESDAVAREIMDDHIVRHFKRGEYAEGILAGAAGIDCLARGKPLPGVPWSMWTYWVGGSLGAFAVAVFYSLGRHGLEGWGWRWMKWCIDTSSNSCERLITGDFGSGFRGRGGLGGGGFSGGGGYSGGGGSSGGATGSW